MRFRFPQIYLDLLLIRTTPVVVAIVIILAATTWFGHARSEYRTPQPPDKIAVGCEHADGEPKGPPTKVQIEGVKESHPEASVGENTDGK